MKVKLPTSLRAWSRQYWNNRPVCLLSAIVVEGEEVELPSLLRYTKGHGNRCSHIKPEPASDMYESVTSSYIPASKTPLINDVHYMYSQSEDPDLDKDSGRLSSDHYRMTERVSERYTNTLTWGVRTKEPNKGKVVWNLRTWCNRTEAGNLRPNGKLETVNTQFEQVISGVGRPVSWDPWYEAYGEVYRAPTSSLRSTYAITIDYNLHTIPAKAFFYENEYAVLWEEKTWSQPVRDAMTLAFQSAFEQVPVYADNNIANMMELGQLVFSALEPNSWQKFIAKYAGKLRGLKTSSKAWAKAMGDLWLTYRYMYSTTKSDTRQAIDTASRRAITYLKSTKFNGVSHFTDPVHGASIECRCEFRIVLNAANMLGMLHHYAQLRGVNISGYKLWDLVPFSFIVDWFLDIGGMLKDQEMLHSYADYLFGNFWWSLKYQTNDKHPYNAKVYSRWSEYYVPDEVIHTYNASGGRTWLKRAGDTVALVANAL